LILKSLLRV
jgi:small GTP-binding protein